MTHEIQKYHKSHYCRLSAFTLIELSIVLVIIGLIAGGILLGRDLIQAAKVRKVISEEQQIIIAMHTYKLKYNALAGDDSNAYNYFGAACGSNNTLYNTGCNGNGDGNIADLPDTGEGPKFFEHLSRAGLIAPNLDGSCILGDSCELHVGTNAMGSQYGSAVWGVLQGACEECGWPSNYLGLNALKRDDGATLEMFVGYAYPLMPVLEVFNIDNKLDDGMPNTGKVRTHTYFGCSINSTDDVTDRYALNGNIKCEPFFDIVQ